MATQPIDTAKTYALTAAGACSVTITNGGKSITWEALPEGGQTSFIVPAGAVVSISDSSALLSPLPANFKAALGAGIGRIGGERFITASSNAPGHHALMMRHSAWCRLPADVSNIKISANSNESCAHSMQLLLAPAADLNTGWLTVSTGVQLVWLYGEPVILSGHTYIIGLTQIATDKILANLLATF